MMDKMSLGDFSPKVMAAIMYAILTLLAFSVYPMLVGAGNTIHLNTENACVWNGVRFDRLVVAGATNKTADDVNWQTYGHSVTGSGKTCQLSLPTTASKYTDMDADGTVLNITSDTARTVILPTGETLSLTIKAQSATNPTVTSFSSAAVWSPPEGMFTDNGTLIDVVIGALALLIGVSPMSVLGMIGYFILNKFDMAQGTVSAIIMVVLGAIITVSLLSTFISFISNAYDAIDAARFTVFAGGLANLAVVIKQFWGVVLIVSFFGLGAMLFKTWRDQRSGDSSGSMAESRVLS